MDRPKSRLAAAMIVACLLAPLALYVTGYFLLGDKSAYPSGNDIARTYTARWQAVTFVPVAFIEAKMTRSNVSLYAAGTRYRPLKEVRSFEP